MPATLRFVKSAARNGSLASPRHPRTRYSQHQVNMTFYRPSAQIMVRYNKLKCQLVLRQLGWPRVHMVFAYRTKRQMSVDRVSSVKTDLECRPTFANPDLYSGILAGFYLNDVLYFPSLRGIPWMAGRVILYAPGGEGRSLVRYDGD